MNAATKLPAERMSITNIENELDQLKEEDRKDSLTFGRRDFKAEAEKAAAQEADEIRAEATLYAGRQRKRSARHSELETALAALKAADVSKELDGITKAHDEALAESRAALAEIDFDTLTALEQKISEYLLAAENVRKRAVEAAIVAKNAGVTPPNLESIHSPALTATYDRFEHLKRQVSSAAQRLSRDQALYNVCFVAI